MTLLVQINVQINEPAFLLLYHLKNSTSTRDHEQELQKQVEEACTLHLPREERQHTHHDDILAPLARPTFSLTGPGVDLSWRLGLAVYMSVSSYYRLF